MDHLSRFSCISYENDLKSEPNLYWITLSGFYQFLYFIIIKYSVCQKKTLMLKTHMTH